jgi:hypothetical protein
MDKTEKPLVAKLGYVALDKTEKIHSCGYTYEKIHSCHVAKLEKKCR